MSKTAKPPAEGFLPHPSSSEQSPAVASSSVPDIGGLQAIFTTLFIQLIFWATPGITNIDRRTCKREVPMQVLVLGMSRTGTSSIRQALKDLGYNDTYHAGCVYKENPRDSEMWVEAYQAKLHGQGKPFGREEFDQLLGHCMATTDVPCLHFKEELLLAYPHAKIILSTRDSPAAWLKSVQSTLIPLAEAQTGTELHKRAYRLFSPKLPFQRMNDEMMKLGSLEEFRATTEETYVEHNDEVRRLVRERNARLRAGGVRVDDRDGLLEFNVKEGYGPLCAFLGRKVPVDAEGKDLPFPRKNDAKEFQQTMGILGNVMNVLVAINVSLTIASLWGAWRVVGLLRERYA